MHQLQSILKLLMRLTTLAIYGVIIYYLISLFAQESTGLGFLRSLL